ncbi:hypothetical protein SAMN05216184_104122 [Georgenia satyanarayanai]|uniref:Uncharacterized protein n=2 Tax=Georgenia satyanarayanai TaxID=860221 RepID=A0A2Y9ADN5_9MICO|nr:hypothetical protein A8987_104122 [Georgenia satyanarayanai]SSA40417.1 hypothetical protein SAMN05216184_104122 [Georgenia satyanarayanai]
MRRQVELMETKATPGAIAVVDVRNRVAPWSVSHFRGDTYSLINGATQPVYDVVLEAPENSIHRGPYRWDRLDPRASVTFFLAFGFGGSGRQVTIRWKWDPEGAEESWTTAMPAKG